MTLRTKSRLLVASSAILCGILVALVPVNFGLAVFTVALFVAGLVWHRAD
jgi:uncharacterized membrane protein